MKSANEQVRVVAEDLQYLSKAWDNSIEDSELRRSSTVLRLLLVQGNLQRAWKQAGFEKEPHILGFGLPEYLQHVPSEIIRFTLTGGAQWKGNLIADLVCWIGELTPADAQALHAAGASLGNVGLSSYIKNPGLIIHGVPIPRNEIINYICNKLGVAHLDPDRNDVHFALLDRVYESFDIGGKPAIYFQLLSIGQAIVASADIQRFCEAVGAPLDDRVQTLSKTLASAPASMGPFSPTFAAPAVARARVQSALELLGIADRLTGAALDAAFALAATRLEDAMKDPETGRDALEGNAHLYLQWAGRSDGAVRASRAHNAEELARRAISLNGAHLLPYVFLSTALLLQFDASEASRRATILEGADKAARRAEGIKVGEGAYNLACVAALRGIPEDARVMLERARASHSLPLASKIASDHDLASLQGLHWFDELSRVGA